MMNPVSKMGVRIGELRRERGLTQEKLASALGISPQAVSKWETGLGLPDIALLPQIAQVLDTTLGDLFGVEEAAAATPISTEVTVAPEQAVAPEVSVVPVPEPENAYFPPEKDGLELISVWRDRACYARKAPKGVQGKLYTWVDGTRVKFEDGSTADLATGEVVNYGGQEIVIDYNDDWEPRRGPEAGDGERAWDCGPIHSLDVRLGGHADCTIYRGTDGSCRVTADGAEDLLAGLEVLEKSGTLVVELKPVQEHKGFWGRWRGKDRQVSIGIHTGFEQGKSCKMKISGSGSIECQPDFDESAVQISGSGDLTMQGAGELNARIAGSGSVDFYSARNAAFSIAGSGDISGKLVAGKLSCSIAGSGDVTLEEVVVEDAGISVAGSGDITIRQLDAQTTGVNVAGSGDITLGSGNGGDLTLTMGGVGSLNASGCEFSGAAIRLDGGTEADIGRITGESRESVARGSKLRVHRRG